MEMPDVGRLLSLGPPALHSLGKRLHAIELGPAFAARLARAGERLDDALRTPLRTWHARRMRGPAAVAARMFLLHDPVTPEAAGDALGELAPLRDAGFVEEGRDGLISRIHLALAGDLYCFGDRPGLGGEAVMPICGVTLDLVRAAMPTGLVDRVLDLGCGAGPAGLLLARAARQVVATDLNPRAALLARLNAAVNGVANFEVRVGDLYEPVASERFDRVVAHPPCVARPAGAAASTFVHGGWHGDEVPLRMLAGSVEHLARGGRAVVMADWPMVDGEGLDTRVRSAVGNGTTDVLVLQSPSKNLDEYCAIMAAVEHGELGESFAAATIAHRDHLEGLALRGLTVACVVVRQGLGWTSLVPVRHFHDAPVTADAIDRLLAARALALGPPETLVRSSLRMTAGARLVEQAMPDGSPPSVVVQLPAGRPEWPAVLDATLAARLARVATSGRVGGTGEAGDGALEAARQGLLRGALESI
jgi:SAM-dependent methyltransferase